MNLTEDQIDDLILEALEEYSGILSYHEIQYTVFKTWPGEGPGEHTRITRGRLRWLSRHGFIYREPDGTWSIVQ